MSEYAVCPVCRGLFELAGTNNLMVHLVGFHPDSDIAQRVMRELIDMPLPEPVYTGSGVRSHELERPFHGRA